MENILPSKKTVVVLKKELAQKTEALNKALKRENELKVINIYFVHNRTLASLFLCNPLTLFSSISRCLWQSYSHCYRNWRVAMKATLLMSSL